jgi:hypothetical protein
MRLLAPVIALACLLPAAAPAQIRLGGLGAPQIPTSIPRAPTVPTATQIPAAPQVPNVPQTPIAPALPSGGVTLPASVIPGGAALPLASLPPPATVLSDIAHGPVVGAADQALQGAASGVQTVVSTARLQRQADLARASPEVLEIDRRGELVRRGQVLAAGLDGRALADAQKMGFAVVERERLAGLGVDLTILRAPAGLGVDDAVAALQAVDAKAAFEPDPIYEAAGSAETPAAAPDARPSRRGKPVDIGLIDTGVAAEHPALSGSRILQQGFAGAGAIAGDHGTAIASLISGEAEGYEGVAPRSTLHVADVYGSGPGGGSASAVVKAIDWLVLQRTPVINISLVGPANPLLEKAIDAAVAKGVVVVAAVGNDGPFSPPLYPAAYRNVVAVTGVDRRDAILAEAVRATPVAFAAPGADILAARRTGGFEAVRGTSFAAPIVAAEIASDHHRLDRRDALQALAKLQSRAVKAPSARTPAAYGWGLVGQDLRPGLTPPLAGRALAELGGK